MDKHMQRLALAGMVVGLVTLVLGAAWVQGAPAGGSARTGDAPGLSTGDYRACVHNNDDDSQTVYYKTDLNKDFGPSFTVAAGGDACSPWTMTFSGARTIYISWTDPDNTETYSLWQSTTVPEGGTVTANFIISRNPLWRVTITNNDDDTLTVWYVMGVGGGLRSQTVPAGGTVTSSSWPGKVGSGVVAAFWTDPDTGEEYELDSPAQTLGIGQTTTFSLTIPRNPLYNVRITNNDDDSLTVYFKLETETGYHSVAVPSGATVTSPSWPGLLYVQETVSLRWTDPDTGQDFTQTSAVTRLELGQTTTFSFTIPRNPLWNVVIRNHDDDTLTVQYKLDTETSYRSMTVPAGGTVTSDSWPAREGTHSVFVKWTDPDLGTEGNSTFYKDLSWGTTTTFDFDILRNPLWHVTIRNDDDDALSVQYKLDTWTSYVTTTPIQPGTTSTFSDWPGSPGGHTVTIKWTDPDLGAESSMTSWTQRLIYGEEARTFSFTIPRFSVHKITVSADPPAGGTPTGMGSYVYGETATVHANPAGSYTFVNWTEGATVVSTLADYAFTVTGNRTLVAHYQQASTATPTRTRTGTATSTAPATASPSRTGTATQAPTITASATPSATASPARTGTATQTPSSTPSATPSATASPSRTGTATQTPSSTASATASPSRTGTATQTPSGTAEVTRTVTVTPTDVATKTTTPTPTATSLLHYLWLPVIFVQQ